MELTRTDLREIFTLEIVGKTNEWEATEAVVDQFLDRYEHEPWRKYHNLNHLGHMATFLCEHREQLEDSRVAFVATLGHDAIYIPGLQHPAMPSGPNEELSSKLTESSFQTILPEKRLKGAGRFIRQTAEHNWNGKNNDLGYFLDADMLILGAEPDEFDEYDEGIVKEYEQVVPLEFFKEYRIDFFKGQLEKDRIFNMDDVVAENEASARANLNRKINEYSK